MKIKIQIVNRKTKKTFTVARNGHIRLFPDGSGGVFIRTKQNDLVLLKKSFYLKDEKLLINGKKVI